MKIVSIETRRERVPLKRPRALPSATVDSADLFFVRVLSEGRLVGIGSASPIPAVTGETPERCQAFLAADRTAWVAGRDLRELRSILRVLASTHREAPAARAALDMALHDLAATALGRPLADLLGRCHESLPTSVRIGIQPAEDAALEAREHVGRGFTHFKVEAGRSFDEDVERLRRIRTAIGRGPRLRVDANGGWSGGDLARLPPLLDELDIELVEQPFPSAALEATRALPVPLRSRIALDESVLGERDAIEAARQPVACGVFDVKLMECGGVAPALAIAETARLAGIGVTWGCSVESRISIAAALHAAFASPATRALDLDGSFDLARDPGAGGFIVEDGKMRTSAEPGLGATLAGG